jgi:hypothetical protein
LTGAAAALPPRAPADGACSFAALVALLGPAAFVLWCAYSRGPQHHLPAGRSAFKAV